MLSSKPAELAKQLTAELESIKAKLAAVEQQLTQYGLLDLSKSVVALQQQVEGLKKHSEETVTLREQVAVLRDQMAEMKKAKEQTDNRVWNVLMIAVGAVLSLLGGVVVQLIAFAIKK